MNRPTIRIAATSRDSTAAPRKRSIVTSNSPSLSVSRTRGTRRGRAEQAAESFPPPYTAIKRGWRGESASLAVRPRRSSPSVFGDSPISGPRSNSFVNLSEKLLEQSSSVTRPSRPPILVATSAIWKVAPPSSRTSRRASFRRNEISGSHKASTPAVGSRRRAERSFAAEYRRCCLAAAIDGTREKLSCAIPP